MSRVGFLGAVSGAAGGFSQFISDELKAERQQAVEELRQEGADQRATRQIEAADQRAENTMEAADRRAANTQAARLAELREADRLESERQGQWADDSINGIPGQRNSATGEFQPINRYNPRPNYTPMTQSYIDDAGNTQERTTGMLIDGKAHDLYGNPMSMYKPEAYELARERLRQMTGKEPTFEEVEQALNTDRKEKRLPQWLLRPGVSY